MTALVATPRPRIRESTQSERTETAQRYPHGFFEIFVSTNITSQQIYVSTAGEMAWDHGVCVNEYKGPEDHTKEEGKYLGVYHKVDVKWKGAVICITPNG
jgi:hypothetical protein